MWLSAIPDGDTRPRSETHDHHELEVSGGRDLVEHLKSLGFSRYNGNGLTGVSYSEIKDWMELMGLELSPWEVETIHRLSAIHAAMSMRATKKDCPAPYEVETKVSRNKRITDLIFG